MMYHSQFVAVIKVNGKVVQEPEPGVFHVPFGEEYVIFLKNLSMNRATVKISIDGKDALDGKELVVNPNCPITVEGFLEGNTFRRRFRFIEETPATREHRGIGAEDGLIRVEYAFELPPPQVTWSYTTAPSWSIPCNSSVAGGGVLRSCAMDSTKGFTAPGTDMSVHTSTAYVGAVSIPEVLVLRLVGRIPEGPVTQVTGVRDKPACPNCGKRCKASMKFCPACGTSLWSQPAVTQCPSCGENAVGARFCPSCGTSLAPRQR